MNQVPRSDIWHDFEALRRSQQQLCTSMQSEIQRMNEHIRECRRFLTQVEEHQKRLERFLIGAKEPW